MNSVDLEAITAIALPAPVGPLPARASGRPAATAAASAGAMRGGRASMLRRLVDRCRHRAAVHEPHADELGEIQDKSAGLAHGRPRRLLRGQFLRLAADVRSRRAYHRALRK